VHELRHKYPVVALLKVVALPKSVFYYWDKVRQKPDKHAETKQRIKAIFDQHKGRYGYRRIALELRNRGQQLHANTVQRLMQKLDLKSLQRRKKYNSYKGEVGVTAPNLLDRKFTATKPNQKWATDITEFKVGDKKIYFSPVKDLFNGEIVAYSMNTKPQFDLVKSMLRKALRKLGKNDKPLLHSDQGWHYRMQGFRKMLSDHDVVQSMSRKANCYDNASMESFFAVLKSECFHTQKFKTIDQLKKELVAYVRYYNHQRISLALDGLSPVQYRLRHMAA
jgi:transposase InsO family protein